MNFFVLTVLVLSIHCILGTSQSLLDELEYDDTYPISKRYGTGLLFHLGKSPTRSRGSWYGKRALAEDTQGDDSGLSDEELLQMSKRYGTGLLYYLAKPRSRSRRPPKGKRSSDKDIWEDDVEELLPVQNKRYGTQLLKWLATPPSRSYRSRTGTRTGKRSTDKHSSDAWGEFVTPRDQFTEETLFDDALFEPKEQNSVSRGKRFGVGLLYYFNRLHRGKGRKQYKQRFG